MLSKVRTASSLIHNLTLYKDNKMLWKMTYNNTNMSGCSARGIALRDTKEELESLKRQLADKIYNVKIEKNEAYTERTVSSK